MRRLEEELARYGRTDNYPMHMPGHKRQAGFLPDLDPAAIDITEIDGFDNLHDPEDLILEEMTTAARFYGTQRTFFSVNGSTCALLAAISAAAPRGSRILIERGCHMAVYHAAYLRNLSLSYIEQPQSGENRTVQENWAEGGSDACQVLADDAQNVQEFPKEESKRSCQPTAGEEQPISAVVITSPTYEGCVKDVAYWADYAHSLGAVLIVDEAHGAHFSIHPGFPASAIREGADIVVQSTHKTLPAMTQTALLHNVTGRVDDARIQYFFDVYETSSPSYVLLASITGAIHLCMDRGEEVFEAYFARLKTLRRRLASLKHYHMAGGEDAVLTCDGEIPGFKAGTVMDPGKIVLLPAPTGLSPEALYAALRDRFHIQPEMKTADYVLCMTSLADTDDGLGRLADAMEALDAEVGMEDDALGMRDGSFSQNSLILGKGTVPHSQIPLAEALDAPREKIQLRDAAGRIAGDFVILYPPDVPIIVPGESFTEELILDIYGWLDAGLTILGLQNEKVDVVAE